jgi:hypothetical protein
MCSFLGNGYLTPVQVEKIEKEISVLLQSLRPHALALVDSFGVPVSNAFHDHAFAILFLSSSGLTYRTIY